MVKYEAPNQYFENMYFSRDTMFKHVSYSYEEYLINAVIDGNENLAIKILDEINMSKKSVLANDPVRSAKNSIICSSAFLARAAIKSGVTSEDAFALNDAVIIYIESLDTAEKVLAYEKKMMLEFISLIKSRKQKQYPRPVARAISYINSELSQKITLSEIAKFCDVHPAYLSKIFKEQTGEKLSEYIMNRKLKESLYFVWNTNIPIAEIADLYSFSSTAYYVNKFKQVFKITPGKLRLGSDEQEIEK